MQATLHQIILFVAATQQTKSDPGHLTDEVSRTHMRYTLTILTKSEQLVAEVAIHTAHNNHNKQLSVPSAGFKPAIPAIERPQTYALDRKVSGISKYHARIIKHSKRHAWDMK